MSALFWLGGAGLLLLLVLCCLGPLPTLYHKYLRQQRLPARAGAPALLLSFDDGPDALYTPQLLRLLAAHGAQATFFLLAEKAAAQPELVRQMLDAGHQISLHGLRHNDCWRMSLSRQRRELRSALAILRSLGCEIRDYRPPYGRIRAGQMRLLRQHGLRLRLWTVIGRDWRGDNAEQLAARLRQRAADGAVICLHDAPAGHARLGSAAAMLDALRSLLPEWRQQGYRFITYDQAEAEAARSRETAAEPEAEAAGSAAPSPLPDARRQRLALLLPALLLTLTVFLLLHNNPLPELMAFSGSFAPRYLLYALGALAVFIGCEAIALRLLLSAGGGRPGYGRALCYALADFYFSAITPGCCGGQPAQLYYMQRDGIAPGRAALALLLFNCAYHLAVLLVAGGCFLLAGLPDLGWGRWLLIYGAGAQLLLALVYVAAVFSPRLLPAALRRVCALLSRLRLGGRLAAGLERQIAAYGLSAAGMRRRPLLLLAALGLALLHILALYSLAWWVYRGFGLAGCDVFTLLAMQAALTLTVESLPLPGGAGVSEGGFLLLYGQIFGAALYPALLLIRGLNYYLPLAAGGLVSALLRPRASRSARRRPRGAGRGHGLYGQGRAAALTRAAKN